MIYGDIFRSVICDGSVVMSLKAAIEVTVVPRSSRRSIVIDGKGDIRVYLNAPPVEGKANEECIAILAKELGIAKSCILIDRGAKGRRKVISVEGMSNAEVMRILKK